MGDKSLWIGNAAPEEKGSFCDTDSGHQYDNTDAFGATAAAQSAEESGREVIAIDEPINANDRVSGSVDDRYNLYYTEKDQSGADHPQRYGPGY